MSIQEVTLPSLDSGRELDHVSQSLVLLSESFSRYGNEFAVVSSFGSESVVLLHLVSQVAKNIPVLFLDTGKLFGETKRYRDTLIERLGLQKVITITPESEQVKSEDPHGILWNENHNRCCFIRKVVPFREALIPYKAWASGRKRYQTLERSSLPSVQEEDGKVKVNPLAGWTKEQIDQYIETHRLPQHPLVADGFKSIGCMTCTDLPTNDQDDRSGRWAGSEKTECGIHLSLSENIRLMNQN
ncbi:phosphoadenylyl-sulfate reductase [Temperatibacter marinus]|uniref:Adenosine 5'-phosphosulfate reductase n=1 Tax=Temperatibacter marinus TaxID=1456591 RepID=A0AA52H868_9PROT|nr:phosphoadenylyl-sulfate reductase [Temperatibacter marinus]WND01524.1 phosphoadenylyl-sulfate reductase [Temperatibacter marinus]